MPDLAVVRVIVSEENGKFIGHRVMPLDGIKPGKFVLNICNFHEKLKLYLYINVIQLLLKKLTKSRKFSYYFQKLVIIYKR